MYHINRNKRQIHSINSINLNKPVKKVLIKFNKYSGLKTYKTLIKPRIKETSLISNWVSKNILQQISKLMIKY